MRDHNMSMRVLILSLAFTFTRSLTHTDCSLADSSCTTHAENTNTLCNNPIDRSIDCDSITFECHGSLVCFSKSIVCPSSARCTVECTGISACQGVANDAVYSCSVTHVNDDTDSSSSSSSAHDGLKNLNLFTAHDASEVTIDCNNGGDHSSHSLCWNGVDDAPYSPVVHYGEHCSLTDTMECVSAVDNNGLWLHQQFEVRAAVIFGTLLTLFMCLMCPSQKDIRKASFLLKFQRHIYAWRSKSSNDDKIKKRADDVVQSNFDRIECIHKMRADKFEHRLSSLRDSGVRMLEDWPQLVEDCSKKHKLLRGDSNDYLNLSEHVQLNQHMQNTLGNGLAVAHYSKLKSNGFNSSTRVRLVENRFAAMIGKKHVFLCNSCYAANQSVLQSLCVGVVKLNIYCDQKAHQSISQSVMHRRDVGLHLFPHNDMPALVKLIEAHGRGLIITEGVFSDSGSKSPLKELQQIKRKYKCLLMVDESHSIGVYGDTGAGICHELGLIDDVDILTASLSKAFNVHAGIVAVHDDIQWWNIKIMGMARIFTTTSSAYAVERCDYITQHVIANPNDGGLRRQKLRNLIQFTNKCIDDFGFSDFIAYIDHPMIAFPTGKLEYALKEIPCCKWRDQLLLQYHIVTFRMIYPAYRRQFGLLRFTLNCEMTHCDILQIFNAIKATKGEYMYDNL